jgi:hypothetical protein
MSVFGSHWNYRSKPRSPCDEKVETKRELSVFLRHQTACVAENSHSSLSSRFAENKSDIGNWALNKSAPDVLEGNDHRPGFKSSALHSTYRVCIEPWCRSNPHSSKSQQVLSCLEENLWVLLYSRVSVVTDFHQLRLPVDLGKIHGFI